MSPSCTSASSSSTDPASRYSIGPRCSGRRTTSAGPSGEAGRAGAGAGAGGAGADGLRDLGGEEREARTRSEGASCGPARSEGPAGHTPEHARERRADAAGPRQRRQRRRGDAAQHLRHRAARSPHRDHRQGCCGATSYMSIDERSAFLLSARNLALAHEEKRQDLVAPCSACYLVLRKTQDYIERYPEIGREVKASLANGGLGALTSIRVRH